MNIARSTAALAVTAFLLAIGQAGAQQIDPFSITVTTLNDATWVDVGTLTYTASTPTTLILSIDYRSTSYGQTLPEGIQASSNIHNWQLINHANNTTYSLGTSYPAAFTWSIPTSSWLSLGQTANLTNPSVPAGTYTLQVQRYTDGPHPYSSLFPSETLSITGIELAALAISPAVQDALNAIIAAYQAGDSQLAGQLTALAQQLAADEGKITNLQQQISAAPTTTDITTLQHTISQLQTQEQSDVAALYAKINTLQSEIDATNARLGDYQKKIPDWQLYGLPAVFGIGGGMAGSIFANKALLPQPSTGAGQTEPRPGYYDKP